MNDARIDKRARDDSRSQRRDSSDFPLKSKDADEMEILNETQPRMCEGNKATR